MSVGGVLWWRPSVPPWPPCLSPRPDGPPPAQPAAWPPPHAWQAVAPESSGPEG